MKHYKVTIASPDDGQIFSEIVKTDKPLMMWMIDFYIEKGWSGEVCGVVVQPLNEAAEWEMNNYELNRSKSLLGQLKASDLIMN